MESFWFNLPFAAMVLVMGVGLGSVNLIAATRQTKWSYIGFFVCSAMGIAGCIFIFSTRGT